MMRRLGILTILLAFCANKSIGQQSDYWERAGGRSPFYLRTGIQALPWVLTPDAFGSYKQSSFKHNQNFVAGFGGAFERAGFNLSLNLPLSFIDTEYANSRFRDFYIGLAGKKRLLEISFRRNKGYSDAGIANYDTTFVPGGAFPVRDDIQLTQFNVNYSRFYNTDYSYKAAYNFSAVQKKSAGSFFLYKHFRYQRIKGSGDFLHPLIQPEYGSFGTIDQLRFWSVGISPGIAGTAVLHGLYISALGSIGLSAQYQKYRLQNDKNNRITFAPSTAGKFAIGYNSHKLFLGLTNAIEFNFSKLPGVWHSTYYYSSYLNIGVRW